jgi:hypothetical protein
MRQIVALLILTSTAMLAAAAELLPGYALWNADRSAAVAATPGQSATRVTAYLRQQDGTFLIVDLSDVESGNFGKLGRSRSDYDRFETVPVEWIARQDGLLQVRVRTQAWRLGQRHTVWEAPVLRQDGTVVWR